jgi:hypothetical protein
MVKYNLSDEMELELSLSKKDTDLITKDGEFEFYVNLTGHAKGEHSNGGKHEAPSSSYDIDLDPVIIEDEYLKEFCNEVGCKDLEAMLKFLQDYDYNENEKVIKYFTSKC